MSMSRSRSVAGSAGCHGEMVERWSVMSHLASDAKKCGAFPAFNALQLLLPLASPLTLQARPCTLQRRQTAEARLPQRRLAARSAASMAPGLWTAKTTTPHHFGPFVQGLLCVVRHGIPPRCSQGTFGCNRSHGQNAPSPQYIRPSRRGEQVTLFFRDTSAPPPMGTDVQSAAAFDIAVHVWVSSPLDVARSRSPAAAGPWLALSPHHAAGPMRAKAWVR
jgi:hypothetical protein